MITVHVPRDDPETETVCVCDASEKIAADIADLFPPRKPAEPDPAQEAQAEQTRELIRKLAETADDRNRLRAKVIDLTNANEGMAREIEAYEDRVQRLIAQVEALENRIDAELDENVHLKAQLYDYVVACGGLLEDDTDDVQD